MDDALFERLLFEEEGEALDFKKEQYRFANASDEDKSELLKDILGFVNAWRRSTAYILIGVEDVRGGRSRVVGIAHSDHLDDHSLQQFVNSLTHRPVQFHYKAFTFEGQQVGVIRIEEQPRPVFLKKNYGRLKKHEVYVRRGSSTNPSAPALPDEIARMGANPTEVSAEVVVDFASTERDEIIGATLTLQSELCRMPARIPDFAEIQTPNFNLHFRINHAYYRELAEYEFSHRLVRPVRFAIRNVGTVGAADVRSEIRMPCGDEVLLVDHLPDVPDRYHDYRTPSLGTIMPARGNWAGSIDLARDAEGWRITMECPNLQPGRVVWSDTIYFGSTVAGEVHLCGQTFASNLPRPIEFTLTIGCSLTSTAMTVEDLKNLPTP